jgi:trehalose 6-phosphate phosphatase
MQHLLKAWPRFREAFARAPRVLLFLDFDGTLAPIVSDPEEARISAAHLTVLRRFAGEERFKVAVVSGRRLEDLEKRVGIPEFIYAGNHGFEVKGPGFHYIHPKAASAAELLGTIAGDLRKSLSPIDGILIENKILTLSVHYRNVPGRAVPTAMAEFLKVLHPYFPRIAYTEGKKVWEVRPAVPWDKGEIVLWLLKNLKGRGSDPDAVLYAGDDQTDESAFLKLKKTGLTLRITDNPSQGTAASTFLLSPDEVYEFFKKLQKLNTPRLC